KGGKMRRMQVQIMRQAPSRTDGFAVPGPYRQRPTGRSNRFEQRAAQQGQTDAATEGGLSPSARLLHRAGILRHKEVRLYGPAMAISLPDLIGGQLPGGRPDQQRSLV